MALGCGCGSVIGAQAAMLVERGLPYSLTALAEATSSRCNPEICCMGESVLPVLPVTHPFLFVPLLELIQSCKPRGKPVPLFLLLLVFFVCLFFLGWLSVLCGIRLVIRVGMRQPPTVMWHH